MDEDEMKKEQKKIKSKAKKKKAKEVTKTATKDITILKKTSSNNDKTLTTTTDEHEKDEHPEHPNDKGSQEKDEKKSLKQPKATKKKRNTTATNETDRAQNTPTLKANKNKSSAPQLKQNDDPGNKTTSTKNKEKNSPNKKPSPTKSSKQKSTLKDFFDSPKSTTPFGKTHTLTKAEIAQAIDIQNEREAHYTITEILMLDDDVPLKRENIAHNSPFQQMEILSTLLHDKAIKIAHDISKEIFAHNCSIQDVDTLIRLYNNEKLLKRFVRELPNKTTLTEESFAPSFHEDIIGQALLEKIDNDTKKVQYKLEAIEKVIPRFYDLRVETLHSMICKCSSNEIDALYYDPGTMN